MRIAFQLQKIDNSAINVGDINTISTHTHSHTHTHTYIYIYACVFALCGPLLLINMD